MAAALGGGLGAFMAGILNVKGMLGMVPDDYATEVGRVATQWGLLEGYLENCIWKLLRVNFSKGRAVTTHINLNLRLDMIATLLSVTRRHSKEWKSWLEACRKLSTARNIAVHAMWVTKPGEPRIAQSISYVARGELRDRGRVTTAAEIKKIAEETAALTIRLIRLSVRLPPLPSTRARQARARRNLQSLLGGTIPKMPVRRRRASSK